MEESSSTDKCTCWEIPSAQESAPSWTSQDTEYQHKGKHLILCYGLELKCLPKYFCSNLLWKWILLPDRSGISLWWFE